MVEGNGNAINLNAIPISPLGRFGRSAEKTISSIAKALNILGIVVLIILTGMTVADVLGRFLFKQPILGTVELTEYMLAAIVYLCISWCAMQDKMVVVDLVINRLPKKVQAVLNSITLTMGLILLILITWQSALESYATTISSKASPILNFPAYPFMWILTLGFAVLCLVVTCKVVQNFNKVVGK